MLEEVTYTALLQRMLAVVRGKNPDMDTRETSPVWYGLAPSAVEMQNLYLALKLLLEETFADTASREPLIKRARERGLSPRPATKMIGRGEFIPPKLSLPMGTRFRLNDYNYIVTEKIGEGSYQLECETPGEGGNEFLGTLLPTEYVKGLETARLTEILIPGEDEEGTEAFRQRYFQSLDAQSFGGNVADYLEKVGALPGVGGVKVYRAWNGDVHPASLVPPAAFSPWFGTLGQEVPPSVKTWLGAVSTAAQDGLLTVGGCVRVVIIDSTFSKPSALLVETVQALIAPPAEHAEGLGIAPIGHFVTVRGVDSVAVDAAFSITYQNGWSWEDVKPYAQAALDAYCKELAKSWESSSEPLIVRISQLETRLLTCPGVVDVTGTLLNGAPSNFTLEANYIPVGGTVYG